MDEERPADHSEDPREQEVAGGGYPETSPAGSDGDAAGARDRSGGDTGSRAPRPSTDKETDRDKATGNPGAAG